MASAVSSPVARKYPVFHAHGCAGCGRRYADTCSTPRENGTCITCRTGQPVSHWDLSRYPDPRCCLTHSLPVTDVVVLNRYALAGPGPWFQCRTCGRTHPFDPTGTTASDLLARKPTSQEDS